jgi:succinate dehydrogenase / fumarate reductase flavoprotein subunit
MQGLADGYFVIPYTFGGYLATIKPGTRIKADDPAVKATQQTVNERIQRLFSINGKETPTHFYRELGKVMWEYSGMGRNEAGLKKALELIPQIREEFWKNLCIPGTGDEVNQSLEMAGRVADFLELGELLVLDALNRRESCGAHFREEWQTEEGEALRDDENFCHVAAWEYKGDGAAPVRHTEQLSFESLHLATRNYK